MTDLRSLRAPMKPPAGPRGHGAEHAPAPKSRTGTKFRAAESRAPSPDARMVDLAAIADEALERTYHIVTHMLAGRPDILAAMQKFGTRLIIIGKDQVYTDMPEYRNHPNPVYQNERVRGTGGLLDTVSNYDQATGNGTGFIFWDLYPGAIADTVGWALSTYFDRPEHVMAMRRRAMQQDFSWDRAAVAYEQLYLEAYRIRRGHELGKE